MALKKIFLIRHGEPEIVGRYIGSRDIGLSRNGRTSLKSQRIMYIDMRFDALLCSPMKRCRETVGQLFPTRKYHILEDLREVDFGLWEGKSFDEIAAEYPTEVDTWANGSSEFRFPDGEKIADFQKRINILAQQIATRREHAILIISHAGVIRHLLCSFLNLSFSNYLNFSIEYGKLSSVDLFDSGGVLTSLNR